MQQVAHGRKRARDLEIAHKASADAKLPENAATTTSASTEILLMEISSLPDYPGNDELNPPCSAAANEQLRASLSNGQRDPIHLMPPGNTAGLPRYMKLDGHRRCSEMAAIGQTHVKAVIRWDLLRADRETVHAEYLRYNRDRRQLDPLALANNYRELLESQRHKPKFGLSDEDKRALVDRLMPLMGGSKRNASRYMHGAHAPHVVQAAHRNGDLGLDDLAKLGMMSVDAQEQIAEQIAACAEPDKQKITAIVSKQIGKRNTNRIKRYMPAALRLIRHLKADLADLDGRYDKLYGPALAPHSDFLRQARNAIDKIIVASRRPGSSVAKLFESPMSSDSDESSCNSPDTVSGDSQ